MKLFNFLSLILINLIIATITYASTPPREFCILNRPPYEGVAGHGYNALMNLDLVSNPREHDIACSLLPGEPVLEIQTIAYTNPSKYPVKLLKEYQANSVVKIPVNQSYINLSHNRGDTKLVIPPGETIYLLMSTGEGTYAAWYNNMIILWVESFDIKGFPSPYPATPPYTGVFMGNSPVECDYWVRLQKTDGHSGWLHNPNHKKIRIDWGRFKEIP